MAGVGGGGIAVANDGDAASSNDSTMTHVGLPGVVVVVARSRLTEGVARYAAFIISSRRTALSRYKAHIKASCHA